MSIPGFLVDILQRRGRPDEQGALTLTLGGSSDDLDPGELLLLEAAGLGQIIEEFEKLYASREPDLATEFRHTPCVSRNMPDSCVKTLDLTLDPRHPAQNAKIDVIEAICTYPTDDYDSAAISRRSTRWTVPVSVSICR